MDFYAILNQVVALLRQLQRVPYWARKIQSHLDEEVLEALRWGSISRNLPYPPYRVIQFSIFPRFPGLSTPSPLVGEGWDGGKVQ
jgi:hypothetical protein